MASGVKYGGYEHEFICEVANRFICQICTRVFREPQLAVCCGQHFCESCLNKWFKRQAKESCPHCRAEGGGFHHVINKGLRSEINELKIKCSNRSKGCEWTGELGQLTVHLESEKGCGFVVVACPNKCQPKSVLLRKDLDKHLKYKCYLRQFQCKYCGHKDTYENITGVRSTSRIVLLVCHYSLCPEFPLACPNKCGTNNIKRKDMGGHRSECPQEPVECPFAEAGCNSKLRRHQLDSHLASHQQQHLLLVMGAYKEVMGAYKEMKVAYEEVKDKLRANEVKLTTAVRLLSQRNEADKETVRSILTCSTHLNKLGSSVEVIMRRVSEYNSTGETWYSLPICFESSKIICLGVIVNKVKPDECVCVGVKFCVPQEQMSDHLNLPKDCGRHRMLPPLHYAHFKPCCLQHFLGCYKDITHTREGSSFHLVNDCLTFRIEYTYDDLHILTCTDTCLKVNIV